MNPKESLTSAAEKERAQWVAAIKGWEREIYFWVRKTCNARQEQGSKCSDQAAVSLM